MRGKILCLLDGIQKLKFQFNIIHIHTHPPTLPIHTHSPLSPKHTQTFHVELEGTPACGTKKINFRINLPRKLYSEI